MTAREGPSKEPHAGDHSTGQIPFTATEISKLPTSVSPIQPLLVLSGRRLPRLASPPQRSIEIRGAFFVEGATTFLAVHRCLDQQVVHQVLHMPRLIGRQITETHHELLHHAHRQRWHFHEMASVTF